MEDNNCNHLPDWVNSGFVLTLIGLGGVCCGSFLLFILKSRCYEIRCCGIKCLRTPLVGSDLENVTIETQTRQSPI
tara:strand:+ start:346 stop:573 length:228 start_codon:yes stop_codon:yes gene_type:complete